MNEKDKRGFTLIELLIVIGIIAILAAAVIVAINPGQQFAAARDATRESHLSTLYNSLISYQVANQGTWGDIDLPQEPTEICDTNEHESSTCETEGLIDLSAPTPNYINQIPVDPHAEDDGTGYKIAEGSVQLLAKYWETRFIGIGVTADQVENGGGGESFSCAEGGKGEHEVEGDTIYCDGSDNMWTPTLDLPAHENDDERYVWSDDCYGDALGCYSLTEGESNTACILNNCDDGGLNAAEQCNALDYVGYSDWYLPAIDTLEILYNDCISDQGLSDGDACFPNYDDNATSPYWSSTESEATGGWNNGLQFSFVDGALFHSAKTQNYRVRCVRK